MQIVFMNQKACLIHLYFGSAPLMLSQGHTVFYSAAFLTRDLYCAQGVLHRSFSTPRRIFFD